ncbi:hypothetical protein C8R44DRAFT_738030 [Mycena epipterygia]|nr:hypothetical protein C8R44DRAFT_738030 [Mycena epipterygia]
MPRLGGPLERSEGGEGHQMDGGLTVKIGLDRPAETAEKGYYIGKSDLRRKLDKSSNPTSNILKGLKCVSTLTELVVLALYVIAINYLYMHVVCASGDHWVNTLDLGPLHEKVVKFCEVVVENTDLLLAPDAMYVTAALNGQQWEYPNSFYAVQHMVLGFLTFLGA